MSKKVMPVALALLFFLGVPAAHASGTAVPQGTILQELLKPEPDLVPEVDCAREVLDVEGEQVPGRGCYAMIGGQQIEATWTFYSLPDERLLETRKGPAIGFVIGTSVILEARISSGDKQFLLRFVGKRMPDRDVFLVYSEDALRQIGEWNETTASNLRCFEGLVEPESKR